MLKKRDLQLNIICLYISQIIGLFLRFIAQQAFISSLGMEYLGLNGLFSDVLMYLSIAELGIGNVMVVALYKYIANKDGNNIRKYIFSFRKIYNIIGTIFVTCGILFLPFIDIYINTVSIPINIHFVYILFLLNSAVPYFFYVDTQFIYINQKQYIMTITKSLFNILQLILQIIVLNTSKNYYSYLLIQLLITIITSLFLKEIAKKLFPILREKGEFSFSLKEMRIILKKTGALFVGSISNIVINNSDRLIIINGLGLMTTGLYTNYMFVYNMIVTIIGIFTNAVSSYIGGYSAEQHIEKTEQLFKKVLLINSLIGIICSQGFIYGVNCFISDYFGSEHVVYGALPLLIGVYLYLKRLSDVVFLFKYNMNILEQDYIRPIIEALLNLILSLSLVKKYGMEGVFFATLASYIIVSFFWESWILYKYSNMIGKYKHYLKFVLKNICCFLIITLSNYFLLSILKGAITLNFLIVACFSVFVACILSIAFYIKDIKEFVSITWRRNI